MSGEPRKTSEWPLAAVLIALIAAVAVLCVLGPAEGWTK